MTDVHIPLPQYLMDNIDRIKSWLADRDIEFVDYCIDMEKEHYRNQFSKKNEEDPRLHFHRTVYPIGSCTNIFLKRVLVVPAEYYDAFWNEFTLHYTVYTKSIRGKFNHGGCPLDEYLRKRFDIRCYVGRNTISFFTEAEYTLAMLSSE